MTVVEDEDQRCRPGGVAEDGGEQLLGVLHPQRGFHARGEVGVLDRGGDDRFEQADSVGPPRVGGDELEEALFGLQVVASEQLTDDRPPSEEGGGVLDLLTGGGDHRGPHQPGLLHEVGEKPRLTDTRRPLDNEGAALPALQAGQPAGEQGTLPVAPDEPARGPLGA